MTLHKNSINITVKYGQENEVILTLSFSNVVKMIILFDSLGLK